MSEQPISTTVAETPEATITRMEYATGAATFVKAKSLAAVTMPPQAFCEMGSLEVARREFAAATDRQAEDLVTEWDRAWGVQS